ncbi:AraC family transcriptional regulator [uncultured Acetatifactor sp.]|jgi:AraC-like DNA-binding protein/quercetin dioxygenase-like cupin family protein|uniref:helix-turn-helix domain-containing protein n=1 Tax=uncultured Acetatifactor sp. TaxID=1671927 RepID=UPI0026297DC9|nr:AraC family transcriptional regulator [uncultured Acetatifactor sp.]
MQSLEYYEQKIISDSEFPVQMFVNDVGKKVWYFNQHWHEHIELHYVLEGRTTLRLGQREIPAREGNLVVVNSNELHAGYCDGTHMRVLVIIFDMGDFYKELADKNVIFQSLVERDETIDAIMSAIQKEYSEQRIGYRLICKGELLHLIVHLAREYAAEVLTERESDSRKRRLERLNTVLDYIQSNYTKQISNRELADIIHLSEDRFNHLFKESMGMPPLQYMNEVRMKKAMNLLKRKEGTVVEIADSVGFTDYNHFGRQFRRYYGCAPSEILKK